ncbi:MAG: hypothetical protein M3Y76_01250, partial [Chloroflexota bacterium]|nr:hypothetical protein [Chloroflexota bacterium]
MQDAVRDARVDRLSKIISDTHQKGGGVGNNKNAGPPRPAFRIHIGLDEGWFSLILLTIVVYSTIWSVQAVNWVDHLNILTLTSLLGLIAGVCAAKLRRFPRLTIHLVATLLAILIAFWQTAGAFDGGN